MVDYQTSANQASTNLAFPERVLTIGAHPDDTEFGAGGSLAKWAASGAHITILVITDGSKGTWDPDLETEVLVAQRLEEQRQAADILGATDIANLGHVDGELEYSMALREEICFHIRHTRPDIVLSHDPWRRYMFHPDHRAAGLAAVDGVVAARDHLFFPHQLTGDLNHHRPAALLLWAADAPDHWEDIDGFIDPKIEALLQHSSQSTTTMADAGQTSDATTAFGDEITARAKASTGPTDFRAAEAFKLMTP